MMHCDSSDSLDEHRILSELRNLDQRLTSKGSTQAHPQTMKIDDKYNSFGRHPELQECDRVFLNQINNMEYFSEINSKDPLQDSLFEHEMHFIANPPTKTQNDRKIVNNMSQQKSKQASQSIKNIKHNQIDGERQTPYEQILKEQTYIFKKKRKEEQIGQNKKPIVSKANPKINKNNSQIEKTKRSTISTTASFSKKEKDKYSSNSQNNICQEKDQRMKEKAKDQDKQISARIKTEGIKQPYEDIETYLSQLVSSQIVSKSGEEESRSRSRIRGKNTTNQVSLQCTFKPKILQKSKQMIKTTKNVVQRLSTNNLRKNQKQPYQPIRASIARPTPQRIEQLSQPRKLKTIGNDEPEQLPSFKPCLSKKSLEHMSNCTYDVATRNKLWLEQKEEKISRLRKEEEEQRFRKEQCTHSPIIKMYKGEQDVQFSRFGKQGMVQYFERLSLMKKKTSSSNIRKEDDFASRDLAEDFSQCNKENTSSNITRQRSSTTNLYKSKKQTYEQAVKSLHSKIMKLKI